MHASIRAKGVKIHDGDDLERLEIHDASLMVALSAVDGVAGTT